MTEPTDRPGPIEQTAATAASGHAAAANRRAAAVSEPAAVSERAAAAVSEREAAAVSASERAAAGERIAGVAERERAAAAGGSERAAATRTAERPAPQRKRISLRAAGVAVRLDLRTTGVTVLLLLGVLVAAAITVVYVGTRIPFADMMDVFAGEGRRADRFVLFDLRLPRLCLGLLAGAALAASGAVFQSLSRNPLGSPDIVGFTTGSASGAVLAIIVFGAGPGGAAFSAVVGGVATAVVVYGLAAIGGGAIRRVVLVGIGVSAMLVALNSYLISRARLDAAQSAAVWLVGTLNGRTWSYVQLLGVALILLTPPLLLMSRRLHLLEMGDDTAHSLGVKAGPTRLILVLLAVAICAVATAATGPVAFVALASPQITKRLARSATLPLLPSMITGALLMVLSDFVAQRLLAPAQMPVGVVTGAVGGAYLAWLLSVQWRKGAS